MNRIKSDGRCRLGNTMLNSLMCILIDGPPLELFNPQAAVTSWSKSAHRRPDSRTKRCNSNEPDVSSMYDSEYDSFSDETDNDFDESELIDDD